LLSVGEESAAEREKLDAANDDVALSLLIAARKRFLVAVYQGESWKSKKLLSRCPKGKARSCAHCAAPSDLFVKFRYATDDACDGPQRQHR